MIFCLSISLPLILAESQAYPMQITVALAVICVLIIAILWLPSVLSKD